LGKSSENRRFLKGSRKESRGTARSHQQKAWAGNNRDVAGVKSAQGPSFSTGLFLIEFECRGGKVKSRRAFYQKPASVLLKAGGLFIKSW
jgi:hypothetical protein